MPTKIEWCRNEDGTPGLTINPVRGLCPVGCSYCYARRHYQRFHLFKDGTPNPTWDYKIRFDVHGYQDAPDWNLKSIKKPSKIFVGSTMELFGEWVEPRWLETLFQVIRRYPQHTFIFLTKRPANLIKWSPFPENCWVGCSVTNQLDADKRLPELCKIDASVRFVSCEPLLGEVNLNAYLLGWANAGTTFENPKGLERYDLDGSPVNSIDWVIIGQQTPANPKTAPKIEWVKEIVTAADKTGIPVFLKDNLWSVLGDGKSPIPDWAQMKYSEHVYVLRQEYPKEVPHVG
jgi:protein gp37